MAKTGKDYQNPTDYYDGSYFEKQSAGGDLQGELNKFKFAKFIKSSDSVLDFGCGSGALLRSLKLPTAQIMGLEINKVAVAYAKSRGTPVRTDMNDLKDETFDVVISNHAIEHVHNPYETIVSLGRVLKKGGKLIVVVPCDVASTHFSEDDYDQHFFSWSAGNLGNLIQSTGLRVISSEAIAHKWPPKWQVIHGIVGANLFHKICRLWAIVDRNRAQVRCVAEKPFP